MTTTVGSTIVVEGEIVGEERVVVLGRVDGKIEVKESVEVARTGVVRAEVDAESMSVAGQMSGRVSARTRIEITPEGKVTADLAAPRITIADGAQFKGNIDMS